MHKLNYSKVSPSNIISGKRPCKKINYAELDDNGFNAADCKANIAKMDNNGFSQKCNTQYSFSRRGMNRPTKTPPATPPCCDPRTVSPNGTVISNSADAKRIMCVEDVLKDDKLIFIHHFLGKTIPPTICLVVCINDGFAQIKCTMLDEHGEFKKCAQGTISKCDADKLHEGNHETLFRIDGVLIHIYMRKKLVTTNDKAKLYQPVTMHDEAQNDEGWDDVDLKMIKLNQMMARTGLRLYHKTCIAELNAMMAEVDLSDVCDAEILNKNSDADALSCDAEVKRVTLDDEF